MYTFLRFLTKLTRPALIVLSSGDLSLHFVIDDGLESYPLSHEGVDACVCVCVIMSLLYLIFTVKTANAKFTE